jgi:hypothetical protein
MQNNVVQSPSPNARVLPSTLVTPDNVDNAFGGGKARERRWAPAPFRQEDAKEQAKRGTDGTLSPHDLSIPLDPGALG